MKHLYLPIVIVQSARAGYAFLLLLMGLAFYFGFFEPTDSMTALFSMAQAWAVILWAIYVLGYVAASVLAWQRKRLAFFIFIGALTIDLGLWVYSSFNALYQASIGGYAALIDMIFNLIDLSIAAGLYFLWRSGELR